MWAKDAACGEALRVHGDLLPVYIPQSTVGIVSGGWGREGDNNIRQQPKQNKTTPMVYFSDGTTFNATQNKLHRVGINLKTKFYMQIFYKTLALKYIKFTKHNKHAAKTSPL